MNIVQNDAQLNCDINFFFHVNRTTWELEWLLTIQWQVTNNIFDRLNHSGLEERIRDITERVWRDSSPASDIIHQDSSSPALSLVHPMSPLYDPNTPIPSWESSLESFYTASSILPPLGSIHNPIVVEDEGDLIPLRNVQDRTPTPGLQRSKRARQIVKWMIGSLKGR
jgi:hypothetical protein